MNETIDSILQFLNIKKSNKIEDFVNCNRKYRGDRRRIKRCKDRQERAKDAGMSLRQYRKNRKEYGNSFLTSDDYLKNFGKSQIFQNNPVTSRWRPYPWPQYKDPLDTSSYVNINGKKFNDLQNSQYLYQKKTKKKMCVNLDKCKKV